MADKCDPIRSQIKVLKTQLSKIKEFEKGPQGKPVKNPDFVEKKNQIKAANARLDKCKATLKS